jgi:hypothetical protein
MTTLRSLPTVEAIAVLRDRQVWSCHRCGLQLSRPHSAHRPQLCTDCLPFVRAREKFTALLAARTPNRERTTNHE